MFPTIDSSQAKFNMNFAMKLARQSVAVFLVLVILAPALVMVPAPAVAEELVAAERCTLPALGDAEAERLQALAEDRQGTPPGERARALLVVSADLIRAAQGSEKRCIRALERGEKAFQKTLKKKTRSVRGNAGAADSEDAAIRDVQQQLRDAFIADQAARLAYLDLATDDREGADFWARRLATANAIELDGANTALLKRLLADFDWIDADRFGPRIASHAWLLAQHADADPAFQQLALERMRPYVDNGGVRPGDYAYLFDRVAVNQGRPQRYGTQPMGECNDDGSLSPKPLEDPAQVDARRAELGLGPMAEAMAEMAARRCR